MKNLPLVSIIMNCYNGEKYLKQSLQSIISQTYENWEIIFWDNLSSDNSKKILNRFNDKRIKYFCSKKFLNLYEARNQALEQASGKYICFLDVDDLYEKEKLFLQVKFLEENAKYKMVYSNYFTLDEQKKNKYIKLKFNLPTGNITKDILKNYTVGVITVLINSEMLKKNKFKNKYNIIGDFDLFIRLSTLTLVGCIQKPLSTYRLHGTNYSKLNTGLFYDELKSWVKENEKEYNKIGANLFYQKIYLFKLYFKYKLEKLILNNKNA